MVLNFKKEESISIVEFQTAMEIYGAKRLEDTGGFEKYYISVPCFEVKGVTFRHSASNYVIQRGVSTMIMKRAMQELGEKYGERQYGVGKIYSIRKLLVIVSMLEEKYTKKLVDDIIGEVYKQLLTYPVLPEKYQFPKQRIQGSKMKELYSLIGEFRKLVNPFYNASLKLRDPREYQEQVKVAFAMRENVEEPEQPYILLDLMAASVKSSFSYFQSRDENVNCITEIIYQQGRRDAYMYICYAYRLVSGKETIYMRCKPDVTKSEEVELSFNLQTGMLQEGVENKLLPVTDKQLEWIIRNFKFSIRKIEKKIIKNLTMEEV